MLEIIPDLADWALDDVLESDEEDENDKNFGVADCEDCDDWDCFSSDADDGDEKQTLEVSGKRMDAQLISHAGEKDVVEPMEEDKSAANIATNEEVSEEDISTEMKGKRKLQENGIGSKQNDSIETANEVKKKNKSLKHK